MDSVPPISRSLDLLGRAVGNHPKFWIKAGNLESALVSMDIENISIRMPTYITGLARSGSTILLEILASIPDTATHKLRDFPFVFTPYWSELLVGRNPLRDKTPRERAHADGILITPDSPEAMEEMLWMAFFPHLHGIDRSNVLDQASNPAFEKFYRQHLKKLLLARKASRYVSKDNYNVTRMGYLQHLFPDARFIVPVRDPVTHIASLMRQQARFCEAGKADPRITRHLSLTGHFEFGPNRRPIHTGDAARMQKIQAAWDGGDEVRGWALYWDAIYRFLHRQLEVKPLLSAHTLFIRFETLCENPEDTLRGLAEHTQLPLDEAAIATWAKRLRMPDYYKPDLSPADIGLIRDLTGETAALYGY